MGAAFSVSDPGLVSDPGSASDPGVSDSGGRLNRSFRMDFSGGRWPRLDLQI